MTVTGKKNRKNGERKVDLKRGNRASNPSSYALRHPNTQNEEARQRYLQTREER
jgi:hypothetical protein